MKKQVISLFLAFGISLVAGAQPQEKRRAITLEEAITIARVQSVDAAVALNELKTAYWEYRTFRADLLPEMNFEATIPSYNKKYNSYQQDNGSYTFVRNNYMEMNGEVSIDQNIWLTGGKLSLNTSLDFLKQLDGDKSKRYMSVPVALTLEQPVFGVNTIKWNRRIEPVRYAEAKAAFADNRMTVDVKLADSLFMVAQITEPLFNYFTACEIKNHLDKNLEVTVNALSEKDAPIAVNLTDVYGDSKTYELSPALIRRMVKSPLAQLDFNEAKTALFAAFEASEEQFRPETEGPVTGFSTSFKGGFYAYDVEFANPRSYKELTTANLKARALKVLEKRYANLGTLRPVLFGMYKTLGIDGFHLVYSAGEGKPSLKTTVTLSNLNK